MRGEFIRGDGLVIPNNVTLAGAEAILVAAFQNAALVIYAALIQATPAIDLASEDVDEPTIGVNGYARIAIPQSNVGWPTVGTSNSEKYIETDWLTFAAVGGNFDEAVQRIALLGTATYTGADPIYMVSELFPTELTITPATLLADRRFKYRFYL